jgi:hypothetical protein
VPCDGLEEMDFGLAIAFIATIRKRLKTMKIEKINSCKNCGYWGSKECHCLKITKENKLEKALKLFDISSINDYDSFADYCTCQDNGGNIFVLGKDKRMWHFSEINGKVVFKVV